MSKFTIRVLCVIPAISHYRLPFFNQLAQHPKIDLCVASGACPLDLGPTGRSFHFANITTSQLGKFQFLRGWEKIARVSDVILYSFGFRQLDVIPALARFGPKLILYGIGKGRSKFGTLFWMEASKYAAAILSYEKGVHVDYEKRGHDKRRLFYIGNTIDVPNHGININQSKKKDFLFVGSLVPRKRLDILISAFAQAVPNLPEDTLLRIVGGGSEESELRAQACRLRIYDRVRFEPNTNDANKLKEYFHSAIVSVGPGQVGLSVLHSFGYGTPVILPRFAEHRGPEVENVEDGVTGLFYDGDVGGLADMIVRVASEPTIVTRLGENAYNRYVSCRKLSHMVDRAVNCIDFVVERAC